MKFFVFFLGLIALVCAAPLEPQYIETDPELTGGYFEGDIILDAAQRNGIRNTAYRWPNKIVYFKIVIGAFDQEHLDQIFLAMRTIEAVSCVRFVRGTTTTPYFMTISGKDTGCNSAVGYQGKAGQASNLAVFPINTGCFRLYTIVHEFLHTLGFYHMQSDSHRDEFVDIVAANIEDGKSQNFVKYQASGLNNFGQEYDYGSVLHYGPYAFSKNGEKTIVALQDIPDGLMGQRVGMSEADIIKLNAMYNCPATTTPAPTTTESTPSVI